MPASFDVKLLLFPNHSSLPFTCASSFHPLPSTGQQSFLDFHSEMRVLLRECLLGPPPEPQDMSIGAQLWRLHHESQVCFFLFAQECKLRSGHV